MRTRPFSELKAKAMRDPVRRARIEEMIRVGRAEILLSRAREKRGLSQQQVADQLGVSQANISRIEHQENVNLLTLRSYVEAIGGELQVKAVFEDQEIYLSVPTKER